MFESRPQPRFWRHRLLPILSWGFAGAVLLCAAVAVSHATGTAPVQQGQLLVPALFGATAGGLFGWRRASAQLLRERLEESEKHLQALYRLMPAMLHTLDANGRLVYVSQSWLDTLAYRADQVIGRPFGDLVVTDLPEQTQRQLLDTLRTQGEIHAARYRLRCGNGREITAELSACAQLGQDGEFLGGLAVLSDLTQQLAAEARLERLVYRDSLTGLPNRALLTDRLLQAIAQARRENHQVGVFFFDLDHFKTINDTQGHATGDMVLRSVAERLKQFIREGDTFARLGGDEFVIVQADPNHDPNFTILARRIVETLAEPFRLGDREFYCTASIGVAIYPRDGDDPQSLLKSADTAMYAAKSRGRNNFQFFSSQMNAQTLARADLEARLTQALHDQELNLHYQPQIDLASGRIVAVEALLRWCARDGRMIPPGEIISVAEESGLIFPLGEWTLTAACRQAAAWRKAGLPPLRMAVNLSGHQIRQANFIDRLEKICRETGMDPTGLEIELTETSVMGHVQEVILALTDLKVRGVSLAIDDFGTGYSSLLYLKHFPIQRVKIAREFILDIHHNPDYAKITDAIISMTRSLGLAVTAVGVENTAQLEFLHLHGCTEVAGSFLVPPLPADDVARLLAADFDFLHRPDSEFPSRRQPAGDSDTALR